MATFAGIKVAATPTLDLHLTESVGAEVARNLAGGAEVFVQGSIDSDKQVSALGGLRWRF